MAATEDSQLASMLDAYGERFMSMFDDYDAEQQRQQLSQTQSRLPVAAANHDGDGDDPCSDSNQVEPEGRKANKSKGNRSTNEIEEILHQQNAKKLKHQAGPRPSRLPSINGIDLRKERKQFMSSQAHKVHEASQASTSGRDSRRDAAEDDDDMDLSPEEFRKLQLEVEKFGATALDKKQRKKWQAQMLARLGSKGDKGPRMAAAIGKGIAKKQAVRDARALEEAIEAGHVKRKGHGKKRKAAQALSRDKGLQEAGPGFKNGILRLAKMAGNKRAGKSSKGGKSFK